MRKVIAGINMTLDGYCDHTSALADENVHNYFTEQLQTAGTLLYGRITYKLMEDYWPEVVKKPTGNKAMDDFAVAIDSVPKIVFSRTLKTLNWKTASLATRTPEEEVAALKQQSGKDIFIGSPSLIVTLTNHNLIDEYRICVHQVIAGQGLPLFKNLTDKKILKLIHTNPFPSGQVVLTYKPETK